MKKAFLISLLLVSLFIVSGCTNPTGTDTTTPPTQTVTATVEQSAFTSSLNTTDLGTKYNAGYLEYLWTDSSSVIMKETVYVKFYMPQIPSGATIESASLDIWITTLDASCTTTITQVTGTWERTTISVTNEPALGSVAAFITSTAVGLNSFDITSLVRDWIDGTAVNHGVRIFPNGALLTGPSGSNRTRFPDYDDPQNYPKISINYH